MYKRETQKKKLFYVYIQFKSTEFLDTGSWGYHITKVGLKQAML